jgi:hypothetical protein
MRTHRWIPMLVMLSALSLAAACDSGADAGGTERGGTQVQDPDAGKESDADGSPSSGSATAREHGTAVNDTAPYRPGTPAKP